MRTKYGDNTELADPTKFADKVWSCDCPPPVLLVAVVPGAEQQLELVLPI